MIDLATLGTFILVVIGLFLVPGPAVLITMTRAITGGRRVGILTGLGIAVGDLIHAVCATVGLSALLMTSALAFNAVKFAGVAYLVYLGVRAFSEKSGSAEMPVWKPLTARAAFSQGLLSEVLNPKTALFFLAFLPQFVRPENGQVIAQFATLGLIFVGLSILYTTALALAAVPIANFLSRRAGSGRWQGKIIGSIYLALAAKVAAQSH